MISEEQGTGVKELRARMVVEREPGSVSCGSSEAELTLVNRRGVARTGPAQLPLGQVQMDAGGVSTTPAAPAAPNPTHHPPQGARAGVGVPSPGPCKPRPWSRPHAVLLEMGTGAHANRENRARTPHNH